MTGGAGFIGSHLAERLVKCAHDVVVVDNESTGQLENVPAGARYVQADVTRPQELQEVFAAGFDAVCQVAGQVSLIRSFRDPLADVRTNLEGTVNVVELCLRHRPACFRKSG